MTLANPQDFITGGDRGLVTTFLLSSAGRGLLAYLQAARGPIVDRETTSEPLTIRAARAQGREDTIELIRALVTPMDTPKGESDYPDVSSDLPGH